MSWENTGAALNDGSRERLSVAIISRSFTWSKRDLTGAPYHSLRQDGKESRVFVR
jgi:hypothetical protein